MNTGTSQPMTEQEKYADLSLKMLALLTGIVLFFPSAFGFIRAPYVADIFLYIFWGAGALGICCHAYSFWKAKYTNDKPVEAAGLANIFTITAILCFTYYIYCNIRDDRTSQPVIVNMESSSLNPSPGDAVSFKAEVKDQDDDEIKYQWEVVWTNTQNQKQEAIISTKNHAAWLVPPMKAKQFDAIVTVTDDNEQPVSDSLTIFINTTNMSQLTDYIESRIRFKITTLSIRNQPENANRLFEVRPILVELATENLETIEKARLNEVTIDKALDLYVQGFRVKFKDPRPCCKDYPGIWPFCKKNCP